MYEDFTQELKDERAQKKGKARARKVEADRKPVQDRARRDICVRGFWRAYYVGSYKFRRRLLAAG